MARGEIEVAPLAFMRGRTLKNAFVIVDEAQNTTVPQMKMVLTRLGRDSADVLQLHTQITEERSAGGREVVGVADVLGSGGVADALDAVRSQGLIRFAGFTGMGDTSVAAIKIVVPEPQFRGQTKQELGTPAVEKIVYDIVKQGLADWFGGGGPKSHINAVRNKLADAVLNRVSSRQLLENRRRAASMGATGLPDKLADCREHGPDSELIIVEGDSAGGSAKQARDRKTQAILPLRGKILNVESASLDKMMNNQEINDLSLALGTALGKKFDMDDLRYDRIIIMTDADVDGAHIASLLITFFYRMTPGLIESGRLFLALPPLYKLSNKGTIVYAMDDADRAEKMKEHFKPNQKVDMTRFKGLGEMNPSQLKETTMNPATRTLARVTLEAIDDVEVPAEELINTLMGKKAELRFRFIQENAAFVEELDI